VRFGGCSCQRTGRRRLWHGYSRPTGFHRRVIWLTVSFGHRLLKRAERLLGILNVQYGAKPSFSGGSWQAVACNFINALPVGLAAGTGVPVFGGDNKYLAVLFTCDHERVVMCQPRSSSGAECLMDERETPHPGTVLGQTRTRKAASRALTIGAAWRDAVSKGSRCGASQRTNPRC
jgi:hypothetical protein